MINEDYVTYEQAKKLKEVGFDGFKWDCDYWYYYSYYNNPNKPIFERREITDSYDVKKYWYAPTLAQAAKWLRDVKDIIIGIDFDNWHDKYICHLYKRMGYSGKNFRDTYGSRLVTNEYHEDFDTYEQALSAGIDKALELLKEENNGK